MLSSECDVLHCQNIFFFSKQATEFANRIKDVQLNNKILLIDCNRLKLYFIQKNI